jgi:hypothetical protein
MKFSNAITTLTLKERPEIRFTPNGTMVAIFDATTIRCEAYGDELSEEIADLDLQPGDEITVRGKEYTYKESKIIYYHITKLLEYKRNG